jgi:N6-adenosine-specific RNA methylase IME4
MTTETIAIGAIRLDDLTLDPATQPRAGLDLAVVADYAEAMAAGATFPALTVYSDGASYWLADGWHRVAGARQAGLAELPAEVREGSRRDAILHSCGANAEHGARRTNEDKRRAVLTLLGDEEWSRWSDREIARRCRVGHAFVSNLRASLSTVDSDNGDRTYRTKHGTVATMDTSNIGGNRYNNRGELIIDDTWHFGDRIATRGRPAPVLTQPIPLEELREQAEAQRRREIVAESSAIRAERAEVRREERVEKMAERAVPAADLSRGPYHVIAADPPWRYQHAESDSRAVENQYPTMSHEEICALAPWGKPVADLAAPDAVLFLWVTAPKLEEGLAVLRAWGFSYRTGWVWDKEAMGMGYWGRIQHEHLLIATRGEPVTPRPEDRPRSVFRAPRGEHSAKPKIVTAAIEAMFPEEALRKVELFQRTPRKGWDGWGNEI